MYSKRLIKVKEILLLQCSFFGIVSIIDGGKALFYITDKPIGSS